MTRRGDVELHQEVGQPLPTEFRPTRGITPGNLIRRELNAHGISQSQLSSRTGLSTKHINQVIQGVVPLSTSTALLLERALGLSANLLTSMEAEQQASLGRTQDRKQLATFVDWFQEFPLGELMRRGIITRSSAVEDQIGQLLTFFGVVDPVTFDRLYAEEALSFRRSQHLVVNSKATAVWLRLAERDASALDCGPYERKAFATLIEDLPKLTHLPLAKAFPQLQTYCARAGVPVVHVANIDGARAYAATRWLGPHRPMIALTGRGKFEDGVWFSFFHEAGHILLHPERRSMVHLEDLRGDDGDGAETEADSFAQQVLLDGIDELHLRAVNSLADVKNLAAKAGVHAGIVAGQAAYVQDTSAMWAKFRPLRRKTPW